MNISSVELDDSAKFYQSVRVYSVSEMASLGSASIGVVQKDGKFLLKASLVPFSSSERERVHLAGLAQYPGDERVYELRLGEDDEDCFVELTESNLSEKEILTLINDL